MNTLAALAALTLALATGCGTTSGGGQVLDCDKARETYALYQASLEVREPSEDEIKYARLAAAFLAAKCGWTPPKSVSVVGSRSKGGETTIVTTQAGEDANGVPILYPPHE